MIAAAYLAPYRLNILVSLAAIAFAEWAADDARKDPEGGQLKPIITKLNDDYGADLRTDLPLDDFEGWTDFRYKVAGFILHHFKLSDRERKALEEREDDGDSSQAEEVA